jgi:hypothetical protein
LVVVAAVALRAILESRVTPEFLVILVRAHKVILALTALFLVILVCKAIQARVRKAILALTETRAIRVLTEQREILVTLEILGLMAIRETLV